ncbi:MAG: M14 family metallopeptidase [Balneolaceae bacterium]
MFKNKLLPVFCFLILLTTASGLFAQVLSPADYLGYELGDRFTPHHRVIGYFNHAAEQSDWVTIQQYGVTNENRELVYVIVTTPANHANIEEIRTNNLKLTGLEEGEPTPNQKAVVWLSYNIHGNETSSSEAAMKTIYELVGPENQEAKSWFENTVVIMDPMVNPDGRDRYVNWFNQMIGTDFNARIDSREHHEPWPGGRSNHYYFDLNRDWAWQIQVESQKRGKIYQEWMPHVHVDYHEQGYNAPYYFAPAAEPFHKAITSWQREFQTAIGMNHTKYFDREGWLYFTREVFDLFYPSYGDTWPTFNGAIGMTYEQAGHGLAGIAIKTAEGDTLTLKDRLTHHHVTGLSTIEVTSQNAERVISEFKNHFERARNNPDSRYKTFVVKADNHPDKIHSLLTFLDSQQIRYGRAGTSRTTDGFDYMQNEIRRVSVQDEDIIISAYQPKSQLVRVLFEPDPELADSVTYDITAWESHYRFGLEGYAITARINPSETIDANDLLSAQVIGSSNNPYAYVAEWKDMNDARFLADITKKGVKSRHSEVPFQIEGRSYDSGTLVITRANNSQLGARFDEIVREAGIKHSRTLHATETGFVTRGSDFGSAKVKFLEKPKVVMISGEGTSSLNVGEIWHFFDHQLQYPVTIINTDRLTRADLSKYNVLILPSGSYSDVLDENGLKTITEWVRAGGRLVAVGNANNVLAGKDGFSLKSKTADDDNEKSEDPGDKLRTWSEREREAIQNTTAGAIYKISLDHTHPLAFGYGEYYHSLKQNALAFEYLDNGWNTGAAKPDAHVSGFVGHKAKEKLEHSLAIGIQSMGQGSVVYMIENPLFRGFWENGKLLFVNAVFLL